jgi:dephospho-CoA kinase
LSRLEARGLDRADAERRMGMQASDEERRAVATWVVDNSGDLEHLERQIDAIWFELEQRAKKTQAEPTEGEAEPESTNRSETQVEPTETT